MDNEGQARQLISPFAANEYGRLKVVVVRWANPFTIDLSNVDALEDGFRRQVQATRWAPYDLLRVHQQQAEFVRVLQESDVGVLYAEKVDGCDSQHYPRDLAFVIDDVFFLARPRHHIRQWEIVGLRPLIERMTSVAYLDAGTIEGGDVIVLDDVVLVGLGEETSPLGVNALRHRLRELQVDRPVVEIELTRRGVVHLDTLFNVVGPDVAIVYPPAFSSRQMTWFDRRFDLIQVTEEEYLSVRVNTLSISPTCTIIDRSSERLIEELEARGIHALPLDFSEVTKIPGSFRCATLPLVRDP